MSNTTPTLEALVDLVDRLVEDIARATGRHPDVVRLGYGLPKPAPRRPGE